MKARPIQTAVFILSAWLISTFLFWQVEWVHRGGPVMIPIIMGSIFSLTIALERLTYFISLGARMSRFFDELREAVYKHRWTEAAALCERTPGPIAKVAAVGLAAREESAEEIEQIMVEAAQDEEPLIERHVRWLSTLAQVSTLMGLLGTVIGMVIAFQVIERKATSADPVSPGDLAGGIWQALITTVAGLEVAIPTILAYSYFLSRIAEIRFQMEKATRLISGWRRHSHGQ